MDQLPETGDCDFVMLHGGVNDAWSKAKIGYLINFQLPAANKGYLSDMMDYVEMTKKICNKWGISYFDMYTHKKHAVENTSFRRVLHLFLPKFPIIFEKPLQKNGKAVEWKGK
ncbi:MAG: hypothetical protein IKD18_04570 [Clostridia bacterium]|nr:hypothetical protein [Clostridia bacterium]